jgi:hypothetical protein
MSVKRNDLAGVVVLYGAIYKVDWEPHPLRPEPTNRLLERVSCPVQAIFAELDHLVSLESILRMRSVLENAKKSFDIRIYPDAPSQDAPRSSVTMPGDAQSHYGQALALCAAATLWTQ